MYEIRKRYAKLNLLIDTSILDGDTTYIYVRENDVLRWSKIYFSSSSDDQIFMKTAYKFLFHHWVLLNINLNRERIVWHLVNPYYWYCISSIIFKLRLMFSYICILSSWPFKKFDRNWENKMCNMYLYSYPVLFYCLSTYWYFRSKHFIRCLTEGLPCSSTILTVISFGVQTSLSKCIQFSGKRRSYVLRISSSIRMCSSTKAYST